MSDTTKSAFSRRRLKLGAAAIALLAIGGGIGAFAGHAFHPPIAMAPVHATAIGKLADDGGIVTVKGRVTERYGNQFVLEDGTGKTLIDAGRAGENAALAPVGAVVSVQGRFDEGALRPSFLVDPSGKVIALHHGGPDGRHHGHGPHGFEGEDGEAPAGVSPDRGATQPTPGPAGPAARLSPPCIHEDHKVGAKCANPISIGQDTMRSDRPTSDIFTIAGSNILHIILVRPQCCGICAITPFLSPPPWHWASPWPDRRGPIPER